MKRLIHLWLLAWVTIPAVTQEWVPMSSISPMETPQTEVTASSAQQFVCKVVIPGFYSQKEMVCELHKRNLRVRSDSNSSL